MTPFLMKTTPRVPRPLPVLLTAVATAVCLLPTLARGQSGVDPSRLTQELQGLGMTDLIERLGSDPTGDPALATAAAVAAADTAFDTTAPDREAALEKALNTLRAAIRANPDDISAPIWRTDLARLLIDRRIRGGTGQMGDLFSDFGITTLQQRRVLAEAAPEALENAFLAANRLFTLEGELAADPAMVQRLRDEGVYTRLIEDYGDRITPIYLAHAQHLVTLLPDDAEYYTDRPLGGVQQPTPAAERTRLSRDAARRLERVLESNLNDLAKHTYRTLLARVYIALGDRQGASQAIQAVLDDKVHTGGMPEVAEQNRVLAYLAKSKLERVNGEHVAAAATAAQASQQPFAERQQGFKLLTFDAQSLALTAQAQAASGEEKQRLLAASFELYKPLMEEMGGVILSRLGNIEGDPASLPPEARVAVGQQRTALGREKLNLATQANDQAGIQAARDILEEAVEINESLVQPDLPDSAQASGKTYLAMSRWALGRDDPATVVASGKALFEVARDFPGEPVAELAIADGVTMLREQAIANPASQDIRDAYAQAATLLQEEYPNLPAATLEREDYAERVLIDEEGDPKAAADAYAKTPRDHALYFRHRLLQLIALKQWLDTVPPAEQAIQRTPVREAAMEVTRDAQGVMGNAGATAELRQDAARAAVEGYYTLAQLAMENKGAAGGDTAAQAVDYVRQATAVLDNFELEQEDTLRLWGNSLQVQALVADRQLDQAAQLVERLMNEDGENARPLVQNLLAVFGEEIGRKRELLDRGGVAPSIAQAYRQEISDAANTASTLAAALDKWGRSQNLPPREMLPVQLLLIKADRLSGKLQPALDLSLHLYEDPNFSNQRGVIVERAETLFAKATESEQPDTEMLEEARKVFSVVAQQPNGAETLGDDFWLANLRLLQIREELGEPSEQIGLALVRFNAKNPGARGSRYAKQFGDLADAHPVSVSQPDIEKAGDIDLGGPVDEPERAPQPVPASEGGVPPMVWLGLGVTLLLVVGLVLFLIKRKPKRPERRSTRATGTAAPSR